MYLSYTNKRVQELIDIIDDMTDIILILQSLVEEDNDNGT